MPDAASPERALAWSRLGEQLPPGFSRLYFGAEFCPWNLPPLDQLQAACRMAHAAGWHFTLVTPVLIEPSLPLLGECFAALAPQLAPGDEILLSDWGGLELARRYAPETPLVLGRTLSGQKRGPRILDLQLTAEQQDYFSEGSWYSASARALLAEEGIARVELDNLLQGLAPLPAGLRGSLHHPYAMVASSRNCPFRARPDAGPCPGGCGEVFTLTTEQTAVPLYQGGNTQFLRNPELPADPLALGIDRLVYHPELPR